MKHSLFLVVLVACGSPMPIAKAPVVVAEFDPAATEPVLPLPNVLALNPDTNLIEVTDPADANDAELAFNAWLRTLDGFPLSSVATLDFSAAVDPATVTKSTVQVFDVTSDMASPFTPSSVTYDGER